MPKRHAGRRGGKRRFNLLKKLKKELAIESLDHNTLREYQNRALSLRILTQQQIDEQSNDRSVFVSNIRESQYGNNGRFQQDKADHGENAAILLCFNRAMKDSVGTEISTITTSTPSSALSSTHTNTANSSDYTSQNIGAFTDAPEIVDNRSHATTASATSRASGSTSTSKKGNLQIMTVK